MAKILILDNDPLFHRFAVSLVEAADHEAQSSLYGAIGLHLLESQRFDLVVLDMNLPDMSGAHVLEQLRERQLDLGVVCFCGFGTIRDAVNSVHMGALDYLEKPCQAADFTTAIERALEAVRCRRAQVQESRKVDAEFGSAAPAIGDPAIRNDVRSVRELLNKLVRIQGRNRSGVKAGSGLTEVDRSQLLGLTLNALMADLSGPLFWALARTIRRLMSPHCVDLLAASIDIETMLQQAIELLVHAKPKTRAIVNHLNIRFAASRTLSVQQLSRELGLNRKNLCRLVKIDTGLSLRQWRWTVLMRTAVRKLVTSDEHIRQIAFAVGYSHPGQFDRDFCRVFGVPPRLFRRLVCPIDWEISGKNSEC